MTPYLSLCAIYRDEASYLREWIEFHRLVGVGRFFLYNNDSVDDHREVVAPYVEDGTVVLHDMPGPAQQLPAYEHCLAEHRADSRWIGFLDLDEFLFSPTGRPLPELLVEYEQWPGVVVNRATFGTSGHLTKRPGLVIENYVRRTRLPAWNRNLKSIVDPRRATECPRPHYFVYESGLAVDENKNPIEPGCESETVSFSRFRVNHYHTKSRAEFEKKLSMIQADGYERPERDIDDLDAKLTKVEDLAILLYQPALHRALAGA